MRLVRGESASVQPVVYQVVWYFITANRIGGNTLKFAKGTFFCIFQLFIDRVI